MSHEPVSIIVPTYKEAENIPILVERICAAMRKAAIDTEIILVDDDSRDGTIECVERLTGRFPVRHMTRIGERGLSSAVVRGFAEARYDILVCMDADLSHPPESLPELIAPVADRRADFCIGSRYTHGGKTKDDWGVFRRLNSWGATMLASPLTSVSDPMAGFFCLRRDTLDRAAESGLNPIGYKIGLEILIKARCRRVREIPIEFSERLHGKSKLTFKQQIEYLRHLGRLYRFRFPVLLPLAMTILVIALVLVVTRLSRSVDW